jgi:excisionase family DNA binding protein
MNFVSFISFAILTKPTITPNIMSVTPKKPTAAEQTTAKRSVATLKQITAASNPEAILNFEVEGSVISVPSSAVKLLEKVLDEMALGNAVEITSVEQELTTQEAADLLNVSRPHIIKLIESGKIPFRKVGSHRRVKQTDVIKYESELKELRRKGLEFLAKEAQEMGLGY